MVGLNRYIKLALLLFTSLRFTIIYFMTLFYISNPKDAFSIKDHLNNYHGFSMATNLSMETVTPYIPMVFDKISPNSQYYIKGLETLKASLNC